MAQSNRPSNPYFKKRFLGLHEPFIPKESEGPCKQCKQIKILGDGYCTNCWDKKTGAARSYFELG